MKQGALRKSQPNAAGLAEERLQFSERLLSLPFESASLLLNRVADEWRSFSKADWVWLWMHNEFGLPRRWEIVSVSPRQEEFLPADLTLADPACIAELAWKKGEPIRVDDLAKVYAEEPASHTVSLRNEIEALSGTHFITIPLSMPATSDPTKKAYPRCVLCLHFRDREHPFSQPDRNLILLGRLTALKVVAAFDADKKSALLELNELSQQFLTRKTNNPESLRRAYCFRLLGVIKKCVRAEWASIFYRDYQFNFSQISCLASTGLLDELDRPVPKDRVGEARYAVGERATGQVYETGKPIISKIGDEKEFRPKYREIDWNMEMSDVSWMMHPIQSLDGSTVVQLGVLRCVQSKPEIAGTRDGNFTQQQAQVMEFIAMQIAPVLETFEKLIARETQIAMIRHDIYDPIAALRGALVTISRYLIQKGDIEPDALKRNLDILQDATGLNNDDFKNWIKEKADHTLRYEMPNLFVQHHILSHVSGELRQSDLIHYEPEKVNIAAKILAPLKSVYWEIARDRKRMSIEFGRFEPPSFPPLFIDPVQIQRVIVNLLMNGVKYGRAGTCIEVLPTEIRGDLGLIVTNQSDISLTADECNLIFEGRYRTPVAKTMANGAGLGLKISRAIMQKHGGDLTVSQHGSTVEFLVLFPNRLKYGPYTPQIGVR